MNNNNQYNNISPPELLDRAVRAIRQTPIPAGPPEKVMTHLFDTADSSRHDPKEKLGRRIFQIKYVSKLAAAIMIMGTIAAWILLMRTSNSNAVFAAVRENFQTVQTLICDVISTASVDGTDQKIRTRIMYKAPCKLRYEFHFIENSKLKHTPSVQIIDFQKSKSLFLNPVTNIATLSYYGKLSAQEKGSVISGTKNYIEQIKTLLQGTYELLGEKIIDGKMAKGFRVFQNNERMDIWVDPSINQPVVIEIFDRATHKRIKLSRFKFNVNLRDSLFSLEAPKGYKLFKEDLSIESLTEQDMLEGFKALAEIHGGQFPPTWYPSQGYAEELIDLSNKSSKDTVFALRKKVERMMHFVDRKVDKSTSGYFGQGLRLGDSKSVLFWYKPKNKKKYRVIYADLHIEEADQHSLPTTQPTSRPK